MDRTAIAVNGDVVLESEIGDFQKRTKSKNFQDLFGGIDPKKLENRDALLQLLVEEKLIDQQVKKLELSASDQEIDRHIRTILERNQISESQLKTRLKALGTSFQEYRDGIRRQIERRNLVDREIKPTLELSDEELRHFLARTAGDSDTHKRYHLAHILIAGKGPKALARAKTVLKKAQENPEGFAALASETSDDSATSSSGGDLGMLTMDLMLKEFHEAVKQTKAGKIYPKLVKSPGGLHVIKVIASEALSFENLPDDRKTELRNQLMAQQLEKKMGLWLDRKKNEAYIRRFTDSKGEAGGI